MSPSSPSDPASDPAPALSVLLGPERLKGRRALSHEVIPDAAQTEALRRALGLDALRKPRLEVTLTPSGARDWQLSGRLGATLVQPCVVTLAPVTTRVDEPVEILFRAEPARPSSAAGEGEAEDDIELSAQEADTEPLPREGIDLGRVLTEALALALPLYPRAPGAELPKAQFAAPGTMPMSDEAARPFAGLSALRDRLGNSDDETS